MKEVVGINFPTTLSDEEKNLLRMIDKLRSVRRTMANMSKVAVSATAGDNLQAERKTTKRRLQKAEEATEEVKRKVLEGALSIKKTNEKKDTFKRSSLVSRRRETVDKKPVIGEMKYESASLDDGFDTYKALGDGPSDGFENYKPSSGPGINDNGFDICSTLSATPNTAADDFDTYKPAHSDGFDTYQGPSSSSVPVSGENDLNKGASDGFDTYTASVPGGDTGDGFSSYRSMKSADSDKFSTSSPFTSDQQLNKGPCLYIRGYDLVVDSLRNAFNKFGLINRISVDDRQKSAFITYASTEEAEEAIKEMDGNMVNGITIRVSFARRQERGSGSYRGGSSEGGGRGRGRGERGGRFRGERGGFRGGRGRGRGRGRGMSNDNASNDPWSTAGNLGDKADSFWSSGSQRSAGGSDGSWNDDAKQDSFNTYSTANKADGTAESASHVWGAQSRELSNADGFDTYTPAGLDSHDSFKTWSPSNDSGGERRGQRGFSERGGRSRGFGGRGGRSSENSGRNNDPWRSFENHGERGASSVSGNKTAGSNDDCWALSKGSETVHAQTKVDDDFDTYKPSNDGGPSGSGNFDTWSSEKKGYGGGFGERGRGAFRDRRGGGNEASSICRTPYKRDRNERNDSDPWGQVGSSSQSTAVTSDADKPGNEQGDDGFSTYNPSSDGAKQFEDNSGSYSERRGRDNGFGSRRGRGAFRGRGGNETSDVWGMHSNQNRNEKNISDSWGQTGSKDHCTTSDPWALSARAVGSTEKLDSNDADDGFDTYKSSTDDNSGHMDSSCGGFDTYTPSSGGNNDSFDAWKRSGESGGGFAERRGRSEFRSRGRGERGGFGGRRGGRRPRRGDGPRNRGGSWQSKSREEGSGDHDPWSVPKDNNDDKADDPWGMQDKDKDGNDKNDDPWSKGDGTGKLSEVDPWGSGGRRSRGDRRPFRGGRGGRRGERGSRGGGDRPRRPRRPFEDIDALSSEELRSNGMSSDPWPQEGRNSPRESDDVVPSSPPPPPPKSEVQVAWSEATRRRPKEGDEDKDDETTDCRSADRAMVTYEDDDPFA